MFVNFLLVFFLSVFTSVSFAGVTLCDHPTPYLGDAQLPSRPAPIEIGDSMLGPGKISRPFVIPTGSVTNPRLWIYGLFRTALQAFRTGAQHDSSEWANRLDIFANLQLTGTERILLHMRPVNKDGDFTSYVFRPERDCGFKNEFNSNITQLFFEGDLGDIFPYWQAEASGPRDIGFAIGRQQFFFQDGIFIDDFIDGLAITQNSLASYAYNNLQISVYLGVNHIDSPDNRPHRRSFLIGYHSSSDLYKHTVDVDLASVHLRNRHHPYDEDQASFKRGDTLVFAVSSVQRIGHWGTTMRGLASRTCACDTIEPNNGVLFFFENNREFGCHHDFLYLNAAAAFGTFSSVARDPIVGGPLGRLGILFAAAGNGNLGSAMNNSANDCVAAAIGYQKFFNFNWQGILEVGSRVNIKTSDADSIAIGARLQRGIGRRCVLRFDAFAGERNRLDSVYGLRCELIAKL